ncbi:MAG: creatininase family protein [Thermaerobacter sp.]|nr:creatininase family protein [Thermaerobacter sp.]
MRIIDMNWMQVEEYLSHDDRVALPLGSVEQHGYLSLGVDALLSERVAVEAAEPLGIPVYPAQPYGVTPYFRDFPGSLSLRVDTYVHVIRDLLDALYGTGFRRILLVNGHGGNQPAGSLAGEWMADHLDARVRFYNWWNAPRTIAKVRSFDPHFSHASWMENFPWTRLANVRLPDGEKPLSDPVHLSLLNPREVRAYLVDGNYGGRYQRPDAEMLEIWAEGVAETHAALEGPWND